MTTDDKRPSRPPYAPLKGVRDFFEKITLKNPPPRIDKEFLAGIGVAANNEQHLIATLRALRLIDTAGVPTKYLNVLYLKGPERTRGLQNLLRLAYPGLFTGEVPLQTASRADIHDYFVRQHNLHGQMARKATALFALLCTLADIKISADLARDAPTAALRRPSRRSAAPHLAEAKDESTQREAQAPAVLRAAGNVAGCTIAVLVTPEMSEDQIVALLTRAKRAVRRVEAEDKED